VNGIQEVDGSIPFSSTRFEVDETPESDARIQAFVVLAALGSDKRTE
jgi:hypothetical protein